MHMLAVVKPKIGTTERTGGTYAISSRHSSSVEAVAA